MSHDVGPRNPAPAPLEGPIRQGTGVPSWMQLVSHRWQDPAEPGLCWSECQGGRAVQIVHVPWQERSLVGGHPRNWSGGLGLGTGWPARASASLHVPPQ